MTTGRRSFTPKSKRDVARLVIEQGYSIPEAYKAMSLGATAVLVKQPCGWVNQLKSEYQGITPRSKGLTVEQQRIQALEKGIKRLELKKEILKL